MDKGLLPLTRLALIVSAVVQTVFGLAMFLLPDLANSLLWSPPLQPLPALGMRYEGALYLACAIGALVAFRQNNWPSARVYLSIAWPYVALALGLAVLGAVAISGVPLLSWLYISLATLYLPIVAWVWMQESRRQTA